MNDKTLNDWVRRQAGHYPLIQALLGRRSRRFGPGMEIPSGPFKYRSAYAPQPLSEEEEAALVFSAAGLNGYALADLSYGRGEGGNMLAGMAGRVVASADSIDNVSLFVINDGGAYFIRRPQNLTPDERDHVISLAQAHEWGQIYRQLRVKITDERIDLPVEPGVNFNINKWALYAPGSTYFLPVNDLTTIYINALLEAFEPEMGLFVVDERNEFQPAGIRRFGRNRGGHLWNDPTDGRVVTVQGLEMSFAEATAVEMGGMLHSLALMAQALGLGGYCNYARNEYHWFEALGFDMQPMSSTEYAGVPPILAFFVDLMGQEYNFPYATGLRHGDDALLVAYCRPNFPDMAAAVRAFVEYKFGPQGVWRQKTLGSHWAAPERYSQQIERPSVEAVEATIAYCSYIDERYGRFPAYAAPYRTVIGYQATHVDVEFYDQFFKPEALTDAQRTRFNLWRSAAEKSRLD
ncbi:MAG: hypothetical protein R3300_04910 [Candidatus Promineifilaceae bacterium]|nr:hypothetical protein [Candidatus Promineifilaceae bacterium]